MNQRQFRQQAQAQDVCPRCGYNMAARGDVGTGIGPGVGYPGVAYPGVGPYPGVGVGPYPGVGYPGIGPYPGVGVDPYPGVGYPGVGPGVGFPGIGFPGLGFPGFGLKK